MYHAIHERCIQSQLLAENEKNQILHFCGPIPFSKKKSLERQGQPFKVQRESRLDSSMNLLLVGRCLRTPSKEGDVMEAIDFQIIQRETQSPSPPTKANLLADLYTKGKLKPETLEAAYTSLLERDLIQNNPLQLTQKGKSIHQEVYRIAGLFLEENFQKIVQESLENIEKGKENEKEFLQEWWEKLKTLLS